MAKSSQMLPAEEFSALQRDLRTFTSADSDSVDMILRVAQSVVEGHSLEVFTIGVTDVLPNGGGLRSAKSAGWKVAGTAGANTIACDIYTVARDGPDPLPEGSRRVASVRKGAPVSKLLTALQALPEMDGQPPATPFLVRILTMPALLTDALWLLPMSLDVAASRLIAYETVVEGLTPGTQYKEADFMQPLAVVAKYWQSRPRTILRA